MKFLCTLIITLLTTLPVLAAQDIAGIWKTIDDETGEAKSLVQIYPYQGKMYGRVVSLFKNQDKKAVGIKGDPKILGLDVIWDMEDEGERWENGHILDPQKGKIYGCEIWREGNNLIVRGKIAFLGRNQTWVWESKAETENLTPVIPVQK